MKRLFGSSKPTTPGPTLDETSQRLDGRIGCLEDKIRKIDQQLVGYKEQLKKLRPGAQRNSVQQNALRLLKQKKM
jgi:charged multivesicular body protein 5